MQYLGLELEHLPNDEQRKAIESIDGPVMVIAGPGTGKTQLLSLRVANILRSRDVSPQNILCLTFTNAGAAAMTKRLAQLIGRDALGVQISTFHSFASGLASQYPEFFKRGVLDTKMPELHAKIKLAQLLGQLSIHDPLYARQREGKPSNLGDMSAFIGTIKKSGLTPGQVRAIAQQNLAFFEYIEKDTPLIGLIDDALGGKHVEKFAKLDALPGQVAKIVAELPEELLAPVVDIPGIYQPYGRCLAAAFENAELYDEEGKTGVFQELRDCFFTARPRKFGDEARCNKLLSAIAIYEEYQAYLEASGFYDYDDMIFDALRALESSDELRATLAERYQYVLVDEFQDTNGSQMHLLNLLLGESQQPNVLVVGDDDQAIYRFQGASVEYLNEFEQHYLDTNRIVLNTNYRSTPSLVGLGQTLARQIENRAPASKTDKKLAAAKSEPEPMSFFAVQYASAELQNYEVAQAIRKRLDEGFMEQSSHPGEEIAVISRKHESLRALIPYLKHFGIPYNYEISSTIERIEPIQTLLHLMRFCVYSARGSSNKAEALLPAIIAAPEFALEPKDYFSFAVSVQSERKTWMAALEDSPHEKLRHLHGWLLELVLASQTSPVRKLIARMAEPLLEYYKQFEESEPFSLIEFNYGVRKLLKFAEDELAAQKNLGDLGPLRLAEVIGQLDEAGRFDIDINVEVPVARSHAISLMTAHKSKGLEFDLVYLIDADDATWHTGGANRGYLSQNMLINDAGDIDDDRRLLFVVATRARKLLEVTFARGELVREFIGELKIVEAKPDLATIATVSTHCWEDDYYPDDLSIMELASPLLEGRKLSVSLLNSFVAYRDKFNESKLGGGAFFRNQILKLPAEPSISLDFGNLVHEMMERVFADVVRSSKATVLELLELYQEKVKRLDYEPSEIAVLSERLDQIAKLFVPSVIELLSDESGVLEFYSERSISTIVDGVPLTGKCDLLVCNGATKTIKVYDYKTGSPDNADFGAAYHRQLQFYKLLIENSSEFEGWTVSGGADLFAEPSKKRGGVMLEPKYIEVSEGELTHLRALASAVWHRIQNNQYDCSTFEESAQLAELKASCDPKKPSAAATQAVFEQWLIDEG